MAPPRAREGLAGCARRSGPRGVGTTSPSQLAARVFASSFCSPPPPPLLSPHPGAPGPRAAQLCLWPARDTCCRGASLSPCCVFSEPAQARGCSGSCLPGFCLYRKVEKRTKSAVLLPVEKIKTCPQNQGPPCSARPSCGEPWGPHLGAAGGAAALPASSLAGPPSRPPRPSELVAWGAGPTSPVGAHGASRCCPCRPGPICPWGRDGPETLW